MRAISFSLHTVAVLAMALAFQGLATAPAGASTLAACLTPGGDMKNVAVGENPARPCGKNDTLIVWEEMEPASECPCDIRAMAGWAGWAGPGCGVVNDPPNNVFVLLDSTDQGSVPLAIVADDTNTGVICRTFNDVNVETLFENLDAVEVAACFDDLDELAFSLGLEGGCAL